MTRFPSSNPFALALAMALITLFALNGSVQADTFWSAETPTTVSDLLSAGNWDNGAPVTADNPGFITGQTITVSSNFDPGTEGQVIDLTFNGNNSTSMSGRFVPLANLPTGMTASVTFRLQDTASINVSGNFWGGINDYNRTYDLGGKEFILYQYYTGDSVFSCNEWWSGMTAKTKILISDNASVTSRGGSYSGLGWDDAAYGSVIDMTDNGKLTVNSSNLDFRGDGTKLNMYDNSTVTSKVLNVNTGKSQVNLFGKSKLSATDINVSSEGALTLSGNSTVSVSNNMTASDTAKITLNDNAKLSAKDINLSSQGALTLSGNSTVSVLRSSSTDTNSGKLTASNTSKIILNGNSAINVGFQFKLDNQSVLTANNNAKLTVTNDSALDRDGAITVNDNAELTFKAQLKIGDVNAGTNGGAVFNQTGGKVTVASNTFFSYHKDATVNLSGGEFYANGNQLYVTDQRGCTADIAMSGSAYLQAKDLRLSQHGNTNLIMTGNSQIKVEDFNVAYNYTVNDNVETVVTMGGSSTVTANNLYFFGMNNNGAAYGSLTLNDSASIIVANDTLIGKGASTGIISGKTYSGIVTLNGNSVFSTTAYTATAGTKSQTNVNGSSTLNATTIAIGPESELNVNGGEVNVGTTLTNAGTATISGGEVNVGTFLTNAGTAAINGGTVNVGTNMINTGSVTFTSGAINLAPYGMIDSSVGTFTATGGTINITVPGSVSYTNGDQLLVGLFADSATANSVASMTVAEGWQAFATTVSGKDAVVASYGDDAPTGIKIWIENASGSMADQANWDGDVNNPTGYVYSGTNTLKNVSGKTIVLGGTNTIEGNMPVNSVLAFNGGTSTYTGTSSKGSIIVNDGTVNIANLIFEDNNGYLEVNGGVVTNTSSWLRTQQDIVVNGGALTVNGNGLAMKYDSVLTNNGGAVTLARIIIGDDAASDGYASNPTGQYTSKYINNAGTTIISGLVEVAQKNNTIGYFEVNGGSVTTSGDFEVAVGTNSKAFLTVAGDDTSFSTKKLYLGHNSSAEYQQTGGTVTVSDTTYFSYHGNVKVDISGGKFIANGGQLYVTDQKDRTADITMTGDAYLQAKDLRLSQHGKTSLTMSGDSTLKVNTLNLAYNYGNGDNVETTIIMSGESRLETGEIRSFGGNIEKTHNGAAYASITMTDNAYLYATGNTWGGYNNASYGPGLLSGKNYNLEMTFKGDSYFSTGEFWMAMSAKSHVTIEGNATVIARSGNSGMGWCNKAAGSLLEIKGGTFQVDSTWFAIGCRDNTDTTNTGVCNVIQTGGQATYKMILLGNNASKYEISGENPVMTADNVTTLTGSTLKISGGTVNIGTLDNGGTLDLSGGTLNIGAGGITASGSYAVNLSGGVISTNGVSWTTNSTVNATVADNSTVTFEPEAGQTIKWTGAFVNSSQNATIVKSGSGTLKIDSPDQNNPSKLESFVINAGELDFKGYFVGALEVKNDAVMSPGNSVGTLTVDGDFILNSAAILLIEQDETGIDQLIAKSFNIDDNAVLDLSIGSIQPGQTYEIFFQKDGDTAVDFTDKYATDDFWNSLLSSENAYYWHLSVNGNVVMATLDANAVPEPSTWALLILGAAGLLYWRKRNSK